MGRETFRASCPLYETLILMYYFHRNQKHILLHILFIKLSKRANIASFF